MENKKVYCQDCVFFVDYLCACECPSLVEDYKKERSEAIAPIKNANPYHYNFNNDCKMYTPKPTLWQRIKKLFNKS